MCQDSVNGCALVDLVTNWAFIEKEIVFTILLVMVFSLRLMENEF